MQTEIEREFRRDVQLGWSKAGPCGGYIKDIYNDRLCSVVRRVSGVYYSDQQRSVTAPLWGTYLLPFLAANFVKTNELCPVRRRTF